MAQAVIYPFYPVCYSEQVKPLYEVLFYDMFFRIKFVGIWRKPHRQIFVYPPRILQNLKNVNNMLLKPFFVMAGTGTSIIVA